MTKTDTQKELDSNIPKSVIKSLSKGGSSFSYLETWHVIDRMNQVLGQGQWGYQISKLEKVFEGEIEQYSGKAFTTSYTAQVALFATIEGKSVIFTEVGYGDGTDKKSQGKAHELATKEAVSDALKRAAKNLGRSMGLALYDKTQEYVGESNKQIDTQGGTVATTGTKSVGTTRPAAGNIKGFDPIEEPPKGSGDVAAETGNNGDKVRAKPPIKELITSAFKVLEAQKKITKEEFKTKYQKGAGLNTLSEPTLQFILASLKTDFPGLGL